MSEKLSVMVIPGQRRHVYVTRPPTVAHCTAGFRTFLPSSLYRIDERSDAAPYHGLRLRTKTPGFVAETIYIPTGRSTRTQIQSYTGSERRSTVPGEMVRSTARCGVAATNDEAAGAATFPGDYDYAYVLYSAAGNRYTPTIRSDTCPNICSDTCPNICFIR